MNTYPETLNDLVDWLEGQGYSLDSNLLDLIEDSIVTTFGEDSIPKIVENIKDQLSYNNQQQPIAYEKFSKLCNISFNIIEKIIKEENIDEDLDNQVILRITLLDMNGNPIEHDSVSDIECSQTFSNKEEAKEKLSEIKEILDVNIDIGDDEL